MYGVEFTDVGGVFRVVDKQVLGRLGIMCLSLELAGLLKSRCNYGV